MLQIAREGGTGDRKKLLATLAIICSKPLRIESQQIISLHILQGVKV